MHFRHTKMTIYDRLSFSSTALTKCALFGLACISLLNLTGCSKNLDDEKTEKTFHQSATLITINPEQSYVIARNYLGQIKAKQHTNLSFEYSGKISELLVDDGDIVRKNQVLAKQDTQLLSYKTAELQAQVSQLKAQIKLNQANLSRIKTLSNDGYSSKQRLDELNAENEILKAQISGLKAQIQTLDYQKEKAILIAPFDGVITKRLTSTGEVTSSSMAIFKIIEQGNNEISVGVPAKLATTLALGQLFNISITDQVNTGQQARLIAIGQQINVINRTIQLRLKLVEDVNKDQRFNGQLVRVAIEDKIQKTGFWLPLEAITDGVRGQWQVFVASPVTGDSDNFTLHTATVNIIHANEHSVYVTGLSLEPHQIVAQGVHRYVGGQVIKITKQNTQLAQQAVTQTATATSTNNSGVQ